MANRARGGIDLSIGGESWAGFTFKAWGKAKDWRLFTPNGESLTSSELVNLRARAFDLSYLQARNRILEGVVSENGKNRTLSRLQRA